jgi:hypothetical protein
MLSWSSLAATAAAEVALWQIRTAAPLCLLLSAATRLASASTTELPSATACISVASMCIDENKAFFTSSNSDWPGLDDNLTMRVRHRAPGRHVLDRRHDHRERNGVTFYVEDPGVTVIQVFVVKLVLGDLAVLGFARAAQLISERKDNALGNVKAEAFSDGRLQQAGIQRRHFLSFFCGRASDDTSCHS